MDKLNTLISTLSAQLQADFWKTMYFAQKTGKVEKTNTFIFALVELALDYYEQPVEQVAQISEKGEAAVEQPTPKKKTTKSAAKRTTTDYQAILALHADGLANTQIAKQIGCSVRTVSRYIKKFTLETKEDNTQLAPVVEEEKAQETTKPVVLEATKQEVKPVEPIRAFSAWDFSDDEEEEADTYIEPVAQLQDCQDAPFPTPEEFFELEGRAHILGMEDEGVTTAVCQRIADTYNGRYTINQIQGAFLRHKSGIGAKSAVKRIIEQEPMIPEEAVVNRLKSQYGTAYIQAAYSQSSPIGVGPF